jgi:hypothetical protein
VERLPSRKLRRDFQILRARLLHKGAELVEKLEMRVVPQVIRVKFVDFHTAPSLFSVKKRFNSCELVEITGGETFLFSSAGRGDIKKRFFPSARAERAEKNVFIPPRGLNGQKKTFFSLRAG